MTDLMEGASMTSNEKIVREAYRRAEGSALDAQGFRELFAEDGTFNDMPNGMTVRGDDIPGALAAFAGIFPDIHRELLQVTTYGDVVAVELLIQGTHLGAFPTPAGEIPPTGHRIDVPTADFWHLRDGRVESFNCYNSASMLLAQIGVAPDFASAVAGSRA